MTKFGIKSLKGEVKIKKASLFFLVVFAIAAFLLNVKSFFKKPNVCSTPSPSLEPSPCLEPSLCLKPPPCYWGRTNDVVLNKQKFTFYDSYSSTSVRGQVKHFQADEYNLTKVVFNPGDVVVDIGANVGVFAIPLAKKFPFLKIYSYEPVPEIYEFFKRNMIINKIPEGVITLVNKAITGDGRNIRMMISRNSWKSRLEDIKKNDSFLHVDEQVIESESVADVFEKYKIGKCRLFKIDCEGCEFEALLNTSDEVFQRIELFRGEFHHFKDLASRGPGYTSCQLFKFVKSKGLNEAQITFWNGKGNEKC